MRNTRNIRKYKNGQNVENKLIGKFIKNFQKINSF